MCTYTRREIITIEGYETRYKPAIALQNVVGFRVVKVACTNAFYNVIQGVNNRFSWIGSDLVNYSVFIPPGQYDPLAFATAWQDTVNSAQATDTFTITYNINTKKYTITSNNAITPLWVSGPKPSSNISRLAGFYNDTVANETNAIQHIGEVPAELVPTHYLLKSQALGAGRKSSGGGGGTQIGSPYITNSPQDYIISIPNQVDGTVSTYAYMSRDEDLDSFTYNAPRQIDTIDLRIVHPWYTDATDDFFSLYLPITYEVEFTCSSQFK